MDSERYDLNKILTKWIGSVQTENLTSLQKKNIDNFLTTQCLSFTATPENVVLAEILGATADAFVNRYQSKPNNLHSRVILPLMGKHPCESTNLRPSDVRELVDIRTASAEELTLVPGIGKESSANFIKWRKISSNNIHSLANVFRPGLLEPKMEARIRRFISIGTDYISSYSVPRSGFAAALEAERNGSTTSKSSGKKSILDQFTDSLDKPAYWPRMRKLRDPFELYDARGREIHDQLKGNLDPGTGNHVAALSGQRYLDVLLRLLARANSSIYIAMNGLSFAKSTKLNKIKDAIVEAVERDVDVRLIYNHGSDEALWKEVIDNFGEVGVSILRDFPSSRTHERTVIIDGKHCITGSVGWTSQSIFRAEDVSLYTQHKKCVEMMNDEFLEQWQSRVEGSSANSKRLSPRLARLVSNVTDSKLASLNESSNAAQIDKILRPNLLPSSIDELSPIGSFLERHELVFDQQPGTKSDAL